MKILIAYDGSKCADAALEDLRSTGLPKTAEAIVMTLADVFLPPPINEEVDNAFPMYVPAGVRRAHERAERELKEAGVMAKRASERSRSCIRLGDDCALYSCKRMGPTLLEPPARATSEEGSIPWIR